MRMSSIKIFLCICLSLLISPPMIPAGDELQPGTVTAIIPFDSPPTYYQEAKTGKPAGFAVDVMNSVADLSGLKVNYIFGKSWTEILGVMQQGKADLAPGMGISEERVKLLAFTSPIDTFPISIFVRSSNDTTTELKKGLVAGGVRGSIAIDQIRKYPGVTVVLYEGFSQGLLALLSGEIDAFCCPAPTLLQLARDAGLEDRIKIVGKPLAEIKRAIAVRKNAAEVLQRINAATEIFIKSPEYQKLYLKWYGRPTPYWTARRVTGLAAAVIIIVILAMGLWRYVSLSRINLTLRQEIEKRSGAERELKQHKDDLEALVGHRTAELEQEVVVRKKAEQENLLAKEEWERTFDAVSDPIMILDTGHRMRRLNTAMAEMIGVSAEEASGKICHEYVHKTDKPLTVCPQCMLLKDGRSHTAEFYEPVLGRYLMVSVYPIIDSAGSLVGSVHYMKDITERKLTEEELRKKAEMVEKIFSMTTTCIAYMDRDFNFIRVNTVYAEADGKTPEYFIGRNHFDLFPNEENEAIFRSVVATGGQFVALARPFEYKDHPERGISHWDWSLTPVKDPGGTVEALILSLVNVTERIRAQEELHKLNEELERRVADRTGELERRGLELRDSRIALMNIVEDLHLKTGELEAANRKLQELDRLKSMFIASMSHELRTPLNSIIGFSSILLNEWVGHVSEEQRVNLAIILRSGKHLLSLINDVIDVSKVEAGIFESHKEDFDLYDVVTEAVASLANEAKDKGLTMKAEPLHLQMHTDRKRFLQCLLNLLSNAVKFTERGRITVSTEPRHDLSGRIDEFVGISVEDTGIGIADDDIPKLFKPFVRLESPLRIAVPGTGLGLYLTKKLVTGVLKGDIMFTKGSAGGSRFEMRMPVRI